MKLFVLLALLISVFSVLGQQPMFPNSIILFRNSGSSFDTCICDRNKVRHEYFFVDGEKKVHYVREGLGSTNLAYKLDTSYVGSNQVIKPVEYISPHEVLTIFKFSKKKNKLYLSTISDGTKSVEELFYDFKTGDNNCLRSPFMDHHPSASQKIKMFKRDSVITFNKNVFKCWCFQEILPEYIINFCIDKKSLIPLAYEIKGVRGEGVIVDGSLYNERFGIWGMLELKNDVMKEINIWKDPF